MVVFMVAYGFSLLEVRKLYIDELHRYYEQVYYQLELDGKIKPGSYDKLIVRTNSAQSENTVDSLRRQMFKSIANRNKNANEHRRK